MENLLLHILLLNTKTYGDIRRFESIFHNEKCRKSL
nr:MAG TPA: hypothetical protein [Caudoviricetes sp.]